MVDAAPSSAVNGVRRFLTFRLNDRLYALAAEEVMEVIRAPPVARVPLAPAALLGVANLRGAVLPVVSLRALLGLAQTHEEGARAIVLGGASPAALAVDAIEALVSVSAGRIEAGNADFAEDAGERISGAFAVEGRGAVKILDVQALLLSAFTARGRRDRQAVARVATPGSQSARGAVSDSETLVIFDVAGQEYALPLSAVREIVSARGGVTQVPRAEAIVVGVIAYRDRLLPLLSLRGLLGFVAPSSPDSRERVLVTAVRGALVGLVVDRARAIVSAERDLMEPIPAMLAARSGGETRLNAVYRGEQGRRLISILSPDQLFREDVMQRLNADQGASGPKPAVATVRERQVLVFRLGEDEFALPIEEVDEVTRVPDEITRVPKTPKFLEGVINLRGDVLPVVDQRRRFDMPRFEGAGRRLIVVRTDRHRAGLIVDSVSEVLRHAENAIGPPPDLTDDISRLVRGVINLAERGRIVLLLDPVELLTRAERELLDSFASKAKAVP